MHGLGHHGRHFGGLGLPDALAVIPAKAPVSVAADVAAEIGSASGGCSRKEI